MPEGLEIRVPYWDFSNLWAGSVMAFNGHVDWLFMPDLYRAELNRSFDIDLAAQEWSYPPHLLLLGGALAKLPIFWAYLLWSAGTIAAFSLTLKKFKIPFPFSYLSYSAQLL